MKQVVLNSLLLGVLCVAPIGVTVMHDATNSTEAPIKRASVQYGSNKRPFSFYYPYNYQYYYPHPTYQGRANSCYWLYTNGSYVYYCN